MAEVLANSLLNPTATLTASATSGDATFTVAPPTSPDGWPTTGQFRVRIDTEIVIVTAASSSATTLTVVTRGAEGTTAAAHSNAASVEIVLTKGAIDQYLVGADGWQNDTSEAWTYASGSGGGAATFTVPTDLTAKYTKGTRIKLTQSTVKYFVVTASSFAAGNTTVNVMAGSDYTLANAAISANFHSYMANPQGWPDWFNWVPTLVGWSGTPTVVARFNVIGRVCNVYMYVSGTSNSTTTTATTPIARVTQPDANATFFAVSLRLTDNGANQTVGGLIQLPQNSSTITFFKDGQGATFTASGTKSIWPSFVYEI